MGDLQYSPENRTDPSEDGYVSILDIFESECGDIKVDRKLADMVGSYVTEFANRNEDHIAFFGGNLMGVQRLRFTTDDRNRWMDDIIGGDDMALKDLISDATDIVATRIVSTDPMNISCMWLCHRFYNSKLPDKVKHRAMLDTMLALQYKFISSILAHWFRYQADHDVAVATYAMLSKKFGLKRHGTWGKLLEYRAEEIVSSRSIHLGTIKTFHNNADIVYMVNDIQGRIKDILKNIRDVFEEVSHDPKMLIRNTSKLGTNLDGDTIVKDMFKDDAKMKRFINTVVMDKTSFVKPELVSIIVDIMPTVHERLFTELLDYMSLNSGRRGDKNIAPFLEGVLDHMFDIQSTLRGPERRRNNITGMLARLRGLYTASKSNDSDLATVKDLGERIASSGVSTKNAAMIKSLRTCIMLYVALRAMAM